MEAEENEGAFGSLGHELALLQSAWFAAKYRLAHSFFLPRTLLGRPFDHSVEYATLLHHSHVSIPDFVASVR